MQDLWQKCQIGSVDRLRDYRQKDLINRCSYPLPSCLELRDARMQRTMNPSRRSSRSFQSVQMPSRSTGAWEVFAHFSLECVSVKPEALLSYFSITSVMTTFIISIFESRRRKALIFIATTLVCLILAYLSFNDPSLADQDNSTRSVGQQTPNQDKIDLSSSVVNLNPIESLRREPSTTKTALIDEIASLTDTLNLDRGSALDILKDIKNEISDITIRASLSGTVIETLVRSGKPEDAWELIDNGYGITRDFQLRAFFAVYQGNDVIEKLASISDQNELNRSLSGYLSARSLDEIKNLDLGNSNLQGSISKPLANALSMLLARGGAPGSDPILSRAKNLEIIKSAAGMVLNGTISKVDFNAIMNDEKMLSAEETFSAIDSSFAGKHETISSQDLNRIRKDSATKLLYTDPLGAIESSIKYSDNDNSNWASSTMNHWLLIDNQAATDWFTKNQARLDTNQRDQVISGFVEHAVTFKEKDTARLWVEQVSNEKTRKMLESKIK